MQYVSPDAGVRFAGCTLQSVGPWTTAGFPAHAKAAQWAPTQCVGGPSIMQHSTQCLPNGLGMPAVSLIVTRSPGAKRAAVIWCDLECPFTGNASQVCQSDLGQGITQVAGAGTPN